MPSAAFTPKILCVDDDASMIQIFGAFIHSIRYEAVLVSSAPAARAALATHCHEIITIISDLRMPEEDGLALRASILPTYRDIPFVILSGHVSRELALQGLTLKIAAFLTKPPDLEALAKIIATDGALRLSSLREKIILERTFIDESRQLLEELEPMILGLEMAPSDQSAISGIFRLVHTIKGGSGVLDEEVVLRFAHRFEDHLSAFKRGDRLITPADINMMLRGADQLAKLLNAAEAKTLGQVNLNEILQFLEAGEAGEAAAGRAPEGANANAANKKHAGVRDGVRVSTATLDEFMELSGEITVFKNMVNKLVRTIEKAHPGSRDVGSLGELLDEMHKINSMMQTKIVDLRKVPLASILRPLPRMIRDLAAALQREIELTTTGEELRIDTAIGVALTDSLVHLVRNSADHGVEPTAARIAAGKPPKGRISIIASEEHEEIIVKVADDGRGIDSERIRLKLTENGMAAADVAAMPEHELLQHIFDAGFSTAAVVSDTSGRGVGMDMVRTAVERVGGKITVSTALGHGTTFTLRMPVPKSVLIISSLLTSVCGQLFAIPQDAVVRLFHLAPSQQRERITTLEGGQVLNFDDQIIPLLDLATLLGLPRDQRLKSDELSVVTLRTGKDIFGLLVDAIIDSEEIVVKPIGSHLEPLGVYAGATFLGDGSVGLILEVSGLAARGCINSLGADDHAEVTTATTQITGAVDEYLLVNLQQRGLFAIPTSAIFRIEEYQQGQLQFTSNSPVLLYRDKVMPVFALDERLGFPDVKPVTAMPTGHVVVIQAGERYFGFVAAQVLDIARADAAVDREFASRKGIAGTTFFGDQAATVVDLAQLLSDHGINIAAPTVGAPLVETPPATSVSATPSAAANQPVATPATAARTANTAPEPSGWGLFD